MMRSKQIIHIALFSITAGVILFLAIYMYISRPPVMHWENDARLMYRISGKTIVLSPENAAAKNNTFTFQNIQISGILNLRIFSINETGIKAGMQFSPIEIKCRGIRDRQIEDIFSKMFYVWFLPNGKLQGFDFSNEIAANDRKSISDVIRSMQIITPNKLFKSWKTQEEDAYGIYSSKYTYNNKLIKQKTEYNELYNEFDPQNNTQLFKIKKSNIEGEYGAPSTWLKKIHSNEIIAIYKNKTDSMVKISSDVDLESIPYNPDESLSIWKDNHNPDEEISQWNSKPAEKFSISDKREIESLDRYYGNHNFNNIVDTLLKKYTSFNGQCVREILNYLDLFPESALDIPGFMLNELNVEQRAMLINALQNNKSGYSQRALVRIITGKEFPSDSRIQSAIAIGDADSAKSDIIKSLLNTYNNRNNTSDVSVKLSDTSLLSLGRIAGTMSYSTKPDDRTAVNMIKDEIRSGFSKSKEPGQLNSVMYAAANTGDKAFIDPILNCFDSPIPSVRSASAQSLSLFNNEETGKILSDKLETENDIGVRSSIVKSLYNMKVSDKTVDLICAQVQNEQNEIVRGEMYRFLLKNRRRSGAKKTMEEMLIVENSFENRDLLIRAITTKK